MLGHCRLLRQSARNIGEARIVDFIDEGEHIQRVHGSWLVANYIQREDDVIPYRDSEQIPPFKAFEERFSLQGSPPIPCVFWLACS